MILIGILSRIAATRFLCWLLVTLAVFALPFFAGATWNMAFGIRTGWLGAILVAAKAGGLTFGIGQLLFVFTRPLWVRIAIALAFSLQLHSPGFMPRMAS